MSFTVPEPTVSLHSDLPNPLLYGSSLTLTCTAELSSEVNVPLMSVSTTWKGPNGTTITLSVAAKMKSLTLYMSSHTVSSLEFIRDSGEYACTMKFRSGIELSANTIITIGNMLAIN